MYDEVTLDRAVQIAAKNGWDGNIERSGYAPLVFNKDFARALWGEDLDFVVVKNNQPEPKMWGLAWINDNEPYRLPKWQYHLQQMVIAPDPLKYLSDNMP